MAALDIPNTLVAKVDRDYFHRPTDDWPSRVGKEFRFVEEYALERRAEMQTWPKVRFRLFDDDENVMYGGWLLNDPQCEVQLEVLRWGAADVGATIIEVRITPSTTSFRREIG